MKIGFFGDSFAAWYTNKHSIENNYTTYIQLLEEALGADIVHLGKGGSSVWDLALIQIPEQLEKEVPDICVCAYSELSRLYHKDIRNLNFKSVNRDNSHIHTAAQEYYKHLYDQKKHELEYVSLLHYLDKKVFPIYNTKFIHLNSFQSVYKWETGVTISTPLYTLSMQGYTEFIEQDERANHLEGITKNTRVFNAILDAIENYEDGREIAILDCDN